MKQLEKEITETNKQSMQEAMNAYSDIKHVIGVVSGTTRRTLE